MRLPRIDNGTLISFHAHESDPLGAERYLRLFAAGAVALARYRETLDRMLARRNAPQSVLESAPFARLPGPMSVEQARFNMVEQQIRTWEVLDQDVLDLLYVVRREEFVPAEYRAFAFSDLEIPLYEGADEGERMMQPKVEARIVQELAVKKSERVLEVGTGSGYLTALLAARAHHVHSVEINPKLKAFGEENLRRNGVENATVQLGDAAQGWRTHAPYDVIVLTGSTPILPQTLVLQLKVGGRLFAVVGDPPVMEARLVTSIGEDSCHTTDLFETCLAPLKNALQPARFEF